MCCTGEVLLWLGGHGPGEPRALPLPQQGSRPAVSPPVYVWELPAHTEGMSVGLSCCLGQTNNICVSGNLTLPRKWQWHIFLGGGGAFKFFPLILFLKPYVAEYCDIINIYMSKIVHGCEPVQKESGHKFKITRTITVSDSYPHHCAL